MWKVTITYLIITSKIVVAFQNDWTFILPLMKCKSANPVWVVSRMSRQSLSFIKFWKKYTYSYMCIYTGYCRMILADNMCCIFFCLITRIQRVKLIDNQPNSLQNSWFKVISGILAPINIKKSFDLWNL